MSDPGYGPNRRAQGPKRVVVVDDSRSIRSWLCHVIGGDTRLEVVGEAADANEARAVIKATNPDVLTLDIEMPGINGLDLLERLMRLRPIPVVMVSSLTKRGSDAAVRALSLGAVDCIVKPANGMDAEIHRDLTRRVYAAACSQFMTPSDAPAGPRATPPTRQHAAGHIVLIGASTGGVTALETVLRGLDPMGPPVVIVQHMPGPFLVSFSQMLNSNLPQDIGLLEDGAALLPGQVRLAPGEGLHSAAYHRLGKWCGAYGTGGNNDLHCPSVDALFFSAVTQASKVTAAILTGLGKDGAAGLKALRDAGAHTIGQDRESAVVYGMPRVAFEMGAVCEQHRLEDIAEAITRATGRKDVRQRAGS